MPCGVAGLSAAIQAARHGSVLVVTKDKVDENNTAYAQGGIAVVLSERDTLIKHVKDTLDAGQELCDKTTVKTIISEGPKREREMIDWGAAFDRQNNHLIFTQERSHRGWTCNGLPGGRCLPGYGVCAVSSHNPLYCRSSAVPHYRNGTRRGRNIKKQKRGTVYAQ